MCLFRLSELYWVSTNMRRISELRQLEMGMSTRRYLPPMGTAGLERCRLSGNRRVPRPPPRIRASTSFVAMRPFSHGAENATGVRGRSRRSAAARVDDAARRAEDHAH